MDSKESPVPDHVIDIFDQLDGSLACRVCGALVPGGEKYAQIHWDWHEAANGA